MYWKVLVPLDGSKESEAVVAALREDLGPVNDLIFLQVIMPSAYVMSGFLTGGYVLDPSEKLEKQRWSEAMKYLMDAVRRLGIDTPAWSCEVAVGQPVSRAIVDFAQQEQVDLIAMYTHDRKGLARLINGSIAGDVRRRAPMDVWIYNSRELEPVMA